MQGLKAAVYQSQANGFVHFARRVWCGCLRCLSDAFFLLSSHKAWLTSADIFQCLPTQADSNGRGYLSRGADSNHYAPAPASNWHHMKKFAWILLVSISFCLLSACGGGGGGDGGSSSPGAGNSSTPGAGNSSTPGTGGGGNTAPVLVGVFLDSAVANIQYRTTTQAGAASKTGTTNAQGQFNYVAGDTVTFFVGNISLPSALAAATITPMDLANTKDSSNNIVFNILVFLQSLDEDGDPSNGIRIPDAANAAATTNIDFNVSPAVFRANPTFLKLVANSGSVTRTPVTLASAQENFTKTLAASGGVVPLPRPSADIAPVAPTTKVGNSISLDGSASTDPGLAALSYSWTLIAPTGSNATLSKTNEAKSTFSIDVSGDYVVSLVVDNGTLTNTRQITVHGVDNVFGSSNLYLYGKDRSDNLVPVYLGCLTCDASQLESVCSTDPASSYGLAPSASSIWDVSFDYGDSTSKYSPWYYPGSEAISPTVATSKGGYLRAFFTNDKSVRDLDSRIDIGNETADQRVIDYLETLFAAPAGRADVLTALCGAGASASISAIQTAKKRQR